MRKDEGSLGREFLPDKTIYGINTFKSCVNFFSISEKVSPEFVNAYLLVIKNRLFLKITTLLSKIMIFLSGKSIPGNKTPGYNDIYFIKNISESE